MPLLLIFFCSSSVVDVINFSCGYYYASLNTSGMWEHFQKALEIWQHILLHFFYSFKYTDSLMQLSGLFIDIFNFLNFKKIKKQNIITVTVYRVEFEFLVLSDFLCFFLLYFGSIFISSHYPLFIINFSVFLYLLSCPPSHFPSLKVCWFCFFVFIHSLNSAVILFYSLTFVSESCIWVRLLPATQAAVRIKCIVNKFLLCNQKIIGSWLHQGWSLLTYMQYHDQLQTV